MKDYKYKFEYTKENGYREATLSSKLQDKLFEYRKPSWRKKYVYFVNKETGVIELCCFIPTYLKILVSLLYPFMIFFYGLGNIKEMNKEYGNMWYEKERGKFSGDTIWKREGSNLYEELLVNLKFKDE